MYVPVKNTFDFIAILTFLVGAFSNTKVDSEVCMRIALHLT